MLSPKVQIHCTAGGAGRTGGKKMCQAVCHKTIRRDILLLDSINVVMLFFRYE